MPEIIECRVEILPDSASLVAGGLKQRGNERLTLRLRQRAQVGAADRTPHVDDVSAPSGDFAESGGEVAGATQAVDCRTGLSACAKPAAPTASFNAQ